MYVRQDQIWIEGLQDKFVLEGIINQETHIISKLGDNSVSVKVTGKTDNMKNVH